MASATVAVMAGMTWSTQGAAQGERRPEAAFAADVVIEQTVVDARGVVVENRPQTRYRMTVRRVNGVRQTEIAYAPGKLFARGPLTDPRGGYRVVFDEGAPAPRLYDATGALVAGSDTTDTAERDTPTASETASLVFHDSDVGGRRQDLRRRLGSPTGKVAGRDRYVERQDATTTETLVDPGSQLPVEINVARNGALEQRSVYSYARMPQGRWHLAVERDEAAMPGHGGRRLVTQKTFLNVESMEER